jgi:alanine dehydrogenase
MFDFKLIKAFDLSRPMVERLIESFPKIYIKACSLEETANADIVCTLTPAREPFLKKEWIVPGTHINAIGADAEGKEELEPAILKEAVVIVDDIRQASMTGEINVPVSKGIFSIGEVYGTLSEVIAATRQGRRDSSEVTVFDSTGIAIEDVAVAKRIYEKSKMEMASFISMDIIEAK